MFDDLFFMILSNKETRFLLLAMLFGLSKNVVNLSYICQVLKRCTTFEESNMYLVLVLKCPSNMMELSISRQKQLKI